MPRLSERVPKYRRHSDNLAYVCLNGRRVYLGKYGSESSKVRYDQLVADWLANGREYRDESSRCTVTELLVRYCEYAQSYYRKHDEVTREYETIVEALRFVRRHYGSLPAAEFSPKKLKTVRESMIQYGWSRKYINKQCGRVKRCFNWGAEEELVPGEVVHALNAVAGLKRGRCAAPDYAPVLPVPESDYQAALPHMSNTVADMCRIARLTGMRPGEIVIMRPMDVSRENSDVLTYIPSSHKTEHQGKQRVIPIGPQAQRILLPYFAKADGDDGFLFVPDDPRTTEPRYNTATYRRHIHRACDRAGVKRWGPNRLRHSAGTEVRARFGLEAAQVMLGHAQANTTEIYAERNLQLAIKIAGEVG